MNGRADNPCVGVCHVVCVDVRWWNDIGMPMTAIQVYMLLFAGGPRGGVLNASHIDSADLLWEGAETWAQWTGQNRIWTRTIVMQKGLLHANESSVNASFEDLFSIVVVEDEQADDGIMADGSFHQHGGFIGWILCGVWVRICSACGLCFADMRAIFGNSYTFTLRRLALFGR